MPVRASEPPTAAAAAALAAARVGLSAPAPASAAGAPDSGTADSPTGADEARAARPVTGWADLPDRAVLAWVGLVWAVCSADTDDGSASSAAAMPAAWGPASESPSANAAAATRAPFLTTDIQRTPSIGKKSWTLSLVLSNVKRKDRQVASGADDGNRTRVFSLGS